MPKTKKINVLTVKLTVHIPHKPGSMLSLHDVTDAIEGLRRYAAELGQTTIETRLNRVSVREIQPPAPAPEASEPALDPETFAEPPDDGLDIPEHLRRTPAPEPAAAE